MSNELEKVQQSKIPSSAAHQVEVGRRGPLRITRKRLELGLLLVGFYFVLLLGFSLLAEKVKVPYEAIALTPVGGGFASTVHLLLGRPGGTDFLCDYASANALWHHGDAYEITAKLTERVGAPWAVSTANTHPPTLMPFILPLVACGYSGALRAWSLGMVFALVLTIRLLDVPWAVAIGVGVALTVSFPGAYGIGNPVFLIGLGIAVAYRWRDDPVIAGLGIAIAAAPKISGILIAIPFLLSRRFKPLVVATCSIAGFAVIPIFFQPDIWSRYLDAGRHAVTANFGRGDNASLLQLAERNGVSPVLVIAVLGILTVIAAIATRDTFWPAVWLMVAALPIAWMSTLMTLVPVAVWIFRKGSTTAVSLVLAAAGLTVGSPPLGRWPVLVFPLVVALMFSALLLTRPVNEGKFWLPDWLSALFLWRQRVGRIE